MCALVSFFHRVAMEPGHRTAAWFQPQERSLRTSCINSPLKVLTLIYGSHTAIWFQPFYLRDHLPASPPPPSAVRGITCTAFLRIKCLGSQAGCYHRRTIYSGIRLPPSLAWQSSHLLTYRTQQKALFFLFQVSFVLKCCQWNTAGCSLFSEGVVGRENSLSLVSGKESNCAIRVWYAPEAYGLFLEKNKSSEEDHYLIQEHGEQEQL